MNLQKRFIETIERNNLCNKGDKILVAVSGGKDSMALLNLFHTSNYKIEAAHFNYRLRGKDSDLDQKLVEDFCLEKGIISHVKSADTRNFAKHESISIQMAARELRYTWFNELCHESNLQYIATAHHLNDNLETLLFGFAKGIRIKGLAGIPLKTKNIIRPILFAKNNDITDYLKEKNIPWRNDQSNFENKYARNKIRNKLIPELKQINPGLEDTFANNLFRFKSLNRLFESGYQEFISHLEKSENGIKIPEDLLQKPGIEIMLEEYLKLFGFGLEEVKTLLNLTENGKIVESQNHKITKERGGLLLTEKTTKESIELEILQRGTFLLGNIKITVEKIAQNNFNQDFSKSNQAFFDADKITFPLTLRPWKQGDRFKPFGMHGKSKLVSDFLKDAKVPLTKKGGYLVLAHAENIYWVVGLRTAEYTAITENTKTIFSIFIENRI